MHEMKTPPGGPDRSRRNAAKIAAIAASALLATFTGPKQAKAANPQGQNSQGQGSQGQNSQGQQGSSGVYCFLKGTRIRTAEGERRIEDLAAGDLLPTFFGGVRAIQWIGRYNFRRADPSKAWSRDVLPVRIARSALGPDIPHADLFVTRAHSLLIDGILVPACSLLNGTTVTLYDAWSHDELEFFHLKLEHHDVIWAEGTPCETLLDVDDSAANFADYLRAFGPAARGEVRCAPFVGYGRRVELQSRVRSAISPWFDHRQQFDIIRDKLEEGEPVLLRQPELVS